MHRRVLWAVVAGLAGWLVLASSAAGRPIVLDFETEDDFATPLINGQSISTFPDVQPCETVFEFGRLVNISTRQLGSDGHKGAAIFDSTPGGPNDGEDANDPDLLVNLGNILILQNDNNESTHLDPAFGLVFDVLNDESSYKDRGSIVFDFLTPQRLISIDLIDVDVDGNPVLTLTDAAGKTRTYDVPPFWTHDVESCPQGWDTLMLDTLVPQVGEGGSIATAWQDDGFDELRVVSLEVALVGCNTSIAIDNLTFVPEPAAACVLGLGAAGLLHRRKR